MSALSGDLFQPGAGLAVHRRGFLQAVPIVLSPTEQLFHHLEIQRSGKLTSSTPPPTFTHIAVDGDLNGVFATYEGTHLGPLGPVPPTGKHAKFDFAGMSKLRDDKLSEFWIPWDNMTMMAQLGLLPAEGEAPA